MQFYVDVASSDMRRRLFSGGGVSFPGRARLTFVTLRPVAATFPSPFAHLARFVVFVTASLFMYVFRLRLAPHIRYVYMVGVHERNHCLGRIRLSSVDDTSMMSV